MIKRKPWIVLLPDDPFKTMWNLLVALLLVYVVTYTPISVCFFEPDYGSMGFGEIVSVVVDCLFFIDIIVNFISESKVSSVRR